MTGAICDMAEEIIQPTEGFFITECCRTRHHSSSVYIKRCPDGDYVFCKDGYGCKT